MNTRDDIVNGNKRLKDLFSFLFLSANRWSDPICVMSANGCIYL